MISEQSLSDLHQAQPVTQKPQLFTDKRLYLDVMGSLEDLMSDPGCSTSFGPMSHLLVTVVRAWDCALSSQFCH